MMKYFFLILALLMALRFQVFIEPRDHTLLHVELMSILL
jgi:hypothetical protein